MRHVGIQKFFKIKIQPKISVFFAYFIKFQDVSLEEEKDEEVKDEEELFQIVVPKTSGNREKNKKDVN